MNEGKLLNSLYNSLKQNQRIHVNIKDNAIQEDPEQSESFNKMASILREVKENQTLFPVQID